MLFPSYGDVVDGSRPRLSQVHAMLESGEWRLVIEITECDEQIFQLSTPLSVREKQKTNTGAGAEQS